MFISFSSNKYKTKFFFYCVLSFYFIVNISIFLTFFINFYCKLVVIKIKINYKVLNWVWIWFPANASFIDFSTDCSLSIAISRYLKRNVNLHLSSFSYDLQWCTIIILKARSLRIQTNPSLAHFLYLWMSYFVSFVSFFILNAFNFFYYQIRHVFNA